jgi:endonuclease/exonuclease/phosphatase family metal-dependent hydrolase
MKAGTGRRVFLGVGLALLTLLLLLLGALLLLEWRPEPVLQTPVEGPAGLSGAAPDRLSLLSWNLGYAGLDAGADFFMDGGTQVRARSETMVLDNLAAQGSFLQAHAADLVLLQEVDRDSSRTFGIDELIPLTQALPEHAWSFAPNYKSPWVPYPLFAPVGRVESGLLSLSRYRLTGAQRLQLPGAFPWPVRVFHLKRCLHELRLPAADGKDWVIVHLHLSTFDRGGSLRRQELDFLRERLLDHVRQGHHVIAAGDWNHALPGVAERGFPGTDPTPDWFMSLDPEWTPPDFRWAYDPATPSLRATNRPYSPGTSFLTIVDGFLVGPGVIIASAKTTDLGFAHSDHQPVRLEVSLP